MQALNQNQCWWLAQTASSENSQDGAYNMANTSFKPRKSELENYLSAEAPAESRSEELERACRVLRQLENRAFGENCCSPVGFAAGQLRLLLLRRQHGIPVKPGKLARARSELRQLLEAGA